MNSQAQTNNESWREWIGPIDWTNLLQISLSGDGLSVTVGIAGLATIIAVVLIGVYLRYRFLAGGRNDVEFEMNIGNLGKVTIKPNHRNVQVAHEAWVEITTRAASVPLDKENDLIAEVYESFYSLFGELRDLTRSIPAQVLRNDDQTMKLVETLVSVMNDGLRPHLTLWRSRFIDWYEHQRSEDQKSATLDIQKRYPHFEELVTDLTQLQSKMQEYTVFLGQLAHGR